jgi:hypothetical protein
MYQLTMTFTDDETASILSDFPKFELSYETMTHKKVFDYNVILAIPQGQSCFAWFTSYKEDNVCFILELDTDFTNINNNNNKNSNNKNSNKNSNKNIIKNIKIGLTGFKDKLALGTVFYGTTFKTNNGLNCFCIEDMYYYKGVNYSARTFVSRLETLKSILETEISQQALTPGYTIFGLPLMNSDLLVLLKDIEMLPYKVTYLKYRWYETKKIMCAEYYSKNKDPMRTNITNNSRAPVETRPIQTQNKPQVQNKQQTQNKPQVQNKQQTQNKQMSYAIFLITPDIKSDIYNLFIVKDGKTEFYDYAFIPDYDTSVNMNRLFRNIKENENLDTLEESDDEGDFEDDRMDKYVYLDRSYKMNCQFNYKFKKWVPISIVNATDPIVSYSKLSFLKM